MNTSTHSQLANFIWKICNLLRGPYKRNEYRKVILPLTVLRRFDCVLASTKQAVLAANKQHSHQPDNLRQQLLEAASGRPFYNTSKLDFDRLLDDPNLLAQNLNAYIHGFSENVQEIIERFGFSDHIARMDEKNLLYEVIKAFAGVDLSMQRVDNMQMGYVFEELIRIGAEQSNEEAGEHFTPREVIRLMVSLLLTPERDLGKSHVVKTIYDPACGTGGMLSVSEEHLLEHNRESRPILYGQDINDEAWAVCKSDMLLKGQDAENIILGDTFTNDGFKLRRNGQRWTFDYMLANPPFGVEWKQQQSYIKHERDTLGYNGRFGAGLPRINDGSLLFLLNMLSKMQPTDGNGGGSRIAIVFNGSPLFTGDAGSGESNIRQWIIENDWLETIVALPDQMFYNTGISTYIWVLTNRKEPHRVGKVQLIDGRQFFTKMRKSLGNKRHELSQAQIDDLTSIHGNFMDSETYDLTDEDPVTHQPRKRPRVVSKVFDNSDFGFQKIIVERPLRLNFAASPERIARLEDEKAFINLAKSKKRAGPQHDAEVAAGKSRQELIRALLAALADEMDGEVVDDRATFRGVLSDIETTAGVRLATPERKVVLSALSERDPDAAICQDRNGNPEPDPALRGTETVPLNEDVDDYMAREVLPHVPDAWVDHSKTKIGYEIPLNRHFYVYEPPRSLDDIDADLHDLENEIIGLLADVTSTRQQYTSYLHSGVEWLGEMPEHWEVKRLEHVASYRTSSVDKKIEDEELPVRLCNYTDVYYRDRVRASDGDFMEATASPHEVARFKLNVGDVLITKDSEDWTDIAVPALVEETADDFVCGYHLGIIRPNSLTDPAFIFRAMQSRAVNRQLQVSASGVTRYGLPSPAVGEVLIPLPPFEEQFAIAAFLARQTERIDALSLQMEAAMERLQEYRAALITAAVTGQIDVREDDGAETRASRT